ncbi:MAG: hypothetical protein A3I04_05885 [Nitrospinae bacterium RIFCSPLOWO2_02_FULL_39_110]|nr:MAG: hypothetical protein A3D97_02565 [Nitrospinae bacterium RIFCSPHIGHO2_12_FULL_39_42]OGV99386.1 MAG: hypothetical protein A2W53_05035 [Nitrospinae bacterium RIFCSPHIGHO2_02_39_11]OGW02962.1 MAG: hypothetical protein A3D20_01560 [Nitrospinae bacterium RIFCSPHIGHO2_02_FULL_39_82]OGW05362.1 MAG: hypothetical protein A3I04_05885 [Nitrospinae bacterium RIFCSPLOWO2_02_FULL_39_110]OGW06612.1 MAG: hypothetical protein A2Z59_02620 [Nitrospinae bacterium RIFCSPLOWO2_02_39_17]OGW10614.1 MAG: hypoth
MTFTVTLIELSFFLIAIGFLMLVVYLIPAIIQFRQTARSIQELSEESKKVLRDTVPVINKVKRQLDGIGDAVEKFKSVGNRLPYIADAVAKQVKRPFVLAAGLAGGIIYIFKSLKRR